MNKISTEIDRKINVRIHKAVGSITVKELILALTKLYLNADYDPNMNSLWDLREADFSTFTQSDINQIKNIVDRHWAKKGKSKSAFVICQHETHRMTQFYEIILNASSEKKIKKFSEYSEAMEWVAKGTA